MQENTRRQMVVLIPQRLHHVDLSGNRRHRAQWENLAQLPLPDSFCWEVWAPLSRLHVLKRFEMQ